MKNFLLRGGTVMTSDGEKTTDLFWEDGVVHYEKGSERNGDALNVSGKLIYPGLIDNHVHFRTPGYEYKGNMITESKSALAGGITTVCDMPNTNPPTVTVSAFSDKVRMAMDACIDIRFFFGMTKLEHLEEFQKFMKATDEATMNLRRRMCGVKLYLENSTGDQKIDEEMIPDVFMACAEFNVLLMAHCEDASMNARSEREFGGITDVSTHSAMRSPESEAKSFRKAIGLAEEFGTPFHGAHVSTWQAVDIIGEAKARGVRVTAEATTHHMFLTTKDYKKLGTYGKMNPPLRPERHIKGVWEGIRNKTIDCIVTDHAPHTKQEKAHPEPLKAPSGVPGVETMIPLLLSVAGNHWPHPKSDRPDGAVLSHADIRRLCFDNPNRIFNLGKADLTQGSKADVVIVDPKKKWIVDAAKLKSQCGWSPFHDFELLGTVDYVLKT